MDDLVRRVVDLESAERKHDDEIGRLNGLVADLRTDLDIANNSIAELESERDGAP